MTASNYQRALSLVLQSEGGYVNNPKDPGGPTNLGVTLATLRAYRGRAVNVNDVKALTRTEAGEVYRANYWNKVKGDNLPSGVDYAAFDLAVNSGPGTAAKFLQRCLRVTDDGNIGPLTLNAASTASARDLVNALCDRRMAYLQSLGSYGEFGKGWKARVASVRKEALAMAAAALQPATHDTPIIDPGPTPVIVPILRPPPPDIPAPEPAAPPDIYPAPTEFWPRLLWFLRVVFAGK